MPNETQDTPDRQFQSFADTFLAADLAMNPTHATQAGEHAHDARWPDLSRAGDDKSRDFYRAKLAALDAFPADKLGLQARVDKEILANQIRYSLYAIDDLKELDWNPSVYTGILGDGLDPMLTREFAPLEDRLKDLKSRLDGVPAVIAAAKARLAHAPKIYTETAIQQNKGLVSLCSDDVPDAAKKSKGDTTALLASAAKAAAALRDYQTFLETDLMPRSDGDFRLGRARFEKKLRFELGDDVDIDAVARGAKQLLDDTREEMVKTALELFPDPAAKKDTAEDKRKIVKAALDKLAEDRPTNATIIAEAKTMLTEATAFVKQHDLARLPEQPCEVIEMPEYRRGVAIAYCEASGPLEKHPQTFYTISPTPKDWPKERAESFYREYNRSMLHELTIHEAMPGHFLQLMHNNEFSSKLRAVYSSGAFVEGWAVYAEWLMAKYGFGGPKVRLERQKMVLRLAANAILDHDIHAGTMDEKAALDLMMNGAFQEEGEAVAKWKRARLSSAQLTTYYYGFTEMMRLRKELEGKPGFSERTYHDKLLSFGSPTMKTIRMIMLAP